MFKKGKGKENRKKSKRGKKKTKKKIFILIFSYTRTDIVADAEIDLLKIQTEMKSRDKVLKKGKQQL